MTRLRSFAVGLNASDGSLGPVPESTCGIAVTECGVMGELVGGGTAQAPRLVTMISMAIAVPSARCRPSATGVPFNNGSDRCRRNP